MNINDIRIVADSSADMSELSGVSFKTAPLKIITSECEYVDNEELDVADMVEHLSRHKGKSSTSCPNESDWLDTFGDATYVFCVTITGTLSGSYNAAMMAKASYEEQHPDRKVFVLDSLTAGPEIGLIIEKIQELVLSGADFDEVCAKAAEYSKKTGTIFMLASMKNLANNGRINPLVAKMAGILGIRVVGKASVNGELEPIGKHRGETRALHAIVQHIKEAGLKKGRVKISHCLNFEAAVVLKEQILAKIEQAKIEISECRGLCGFYAEKGGLIVGFENI